MTRRRVAHVLSTALVTTGLVVFLDVAITLAWQEPLSSLAGWWEQRQAADELDEVEREFADAAPELGQRLNRTEVAGLAGRYADDLKTGQAIGRLEIEAIGVDFVMVEGTDTATLRRGPGHFPETVLPGQRGTVAVAGHRTTYLAPFKEVNEIEEGDRAVLEMPYGRFTYEFEKQRIVEPTQSGVVRDVGHDRLVLTACHPLYSADQRIVIFFRLLRSDPP